VKNSEYFKGKNITIIGLARSGLSCANLLHGLGARVSLSESQDTPQTRSFAAKLVSEEIKYELGKHTPEFIEGRDLVVVSPGVPDSSEAVRWAQKLKIPLSSEIEVAAVLCPATIIAVTGSCGKTTVTTLIGRILEAAGKKTFVCGNIGNPFSGEVSRMAADDFVSLEVSSFQLERIKTFKPKIALILNFTQNHLDRYNDMREYLLAKQRIFMNQERDDFLVLNADDPVLKKLAAEAKAKTVLFSRQDAANPNQAAVLAVAGILGIEKKICADVLTHFRGVEHRLELVRTINGVSFINDSKATTVDSAIWALENIHSPVILIAGGKDKGLDYSLILPFAQGKVKDVILIGEARNKIRRALQGGMPLEEAATLQEAVERARAKALPGDCVLLSPMCSSFDMFTSYEERGRVFKEIVGRLP
jgi:UDP-N-acetylmuramoylalanine--D-glutamate ligase